MSIDELNRRIENYRNFINIRDLTEQRIKHELRKGFSVNIDHREFSFFVNVDIQTLPHNRDYFFRIREFSDSDHNGLLTRQFPSMQKKQDAWYRPDCDVKNYGRLNRPGESVLYVSKQTTNAIYEKNCQYDDFFFLIVYKSKPDLRFSQIHNIQYLSEFNELENAKRIIMHNFLFNEFIKHVIAGREYLYKSSLLIYENYFYNTKIDGFGYPSIASNNKGGFNVCFTKNQADRSIELVGVMVCQLLPSFNSEFKIKPIYDGILDDYDSFTFFNYNSETSKRKFGEFCMIREMGL